MTADPRPKPGDTLLECKHGPDPYNAHLFEMRAPGVNGLPFTRPDGTVGKAQWVVLCKRCFVKYAGHYQDAPILRDFVWPEDAAPVEYEKSS